MKSFKPEDIIVVLNSILDIDQSYRGLDYLKTLIENTALAFQAKYVFIGHAIKPSNQRVQTDLVWDGKSYQENFIYELAGTPCENVLSGKRICIYTDNVVQEFPKDILLYDMGIKSYIGSPMLNSEGDLSGIFVLLDDKPFESNDIHSSIIDFLTIRISVELERYYQEEELKKKVTIRTAELIKTNKELKKSLNEIKSLQGLIPICLHCKRIRDDDEGYWRKLETYLTEHSEGKLSHGVCPECMENLYPEIKIPDCWAFKNCGREKTKDCPAVIHNKGKECWLVSGTMCEGKIQGTFAKKIKSCIECDYYKFISTPVQKD